MAYSKELKRQNEALGDILAGRETEKRVMVGYEGKKDVKGGETRQSELTDIMKDIRMPWFCPECKKVMKHRNDNKMWTLFKHCFDCQLNFEHVLRATGKFEQWEEERILRNKIALIKNDIIELTDWKQNTSFDIVEPVNVETGFVHIEKHELTGKMVSEAEKVLDILNKKLKDFVNRLNEMKNAD